ncbi:hypothetical protein KSP40_PGU005276 [Platanthera guangdongensis]|uniref:RNase H type-1 domain-containing protein n=1 Tax=Platanthera guangdongensis TaxID=2320717 RepID=A0ABR2LHG6_9ASPA
MLWEGVLQPLGKTILFVLCAISTPSVDAREPGVPSSDRWIPPHIGVIKINIDGAFRAEISLGGMEVIVRDSSGQCLSWRLSWCSHVSSPAVAGALVAWIGVEFGLSSMTMEGDC